MAEREWKPTDSQLAFAQDVAATLGTDDENITESYRKAYPDAHGKYLNVEAHRLLKNPHIKALIEEIQQGMRDKFVLLAPSALETLRELSESADSETVKLNATIEILDRAGLTKIQKVEFTPLGVFGSANPEDIKKQIRERQDNLKIVKEKVEAAA